MNDHKCKREECPNVEANRLNCPCTCTGCERHSVCCECIQFHRDRGDKPACMR